MSDYLIAHVSHTVREHEHITWWKPGSLGYTICIDKAGRYSEAEAKSCCQWGSCIAVPVDKVESLARSTPYYRRSNGTLGRLYDGGSHRPVENDAQVWRELLGARLPMERRPDKPTPMAASKRRAIYLDTELAHG